MDAKALKSLKAAYEASPDNSHLLAVLVQGLWESGEVRQAYEILKDKRADQWPAETDNRAAIEVLIEVGDFYQALTFVRGADAEQLILKAKALHALKLDDDARQAYHEAITQNPTLEDRELQAALNPEPAPNPVLDTGFDGDEDLRVPAISNDDTAETEIQRVLMPEQASATFADVGGLERVKSEIRRKIILPFIKPSLFQKFKRRAGGGILMYGPPGCGKTLLARATAGECQARFFNVAISDVLSMWFGQSEEKLHALFEKARRDAPSVMFFDELEAIGGKRQFSHDSVAAKLVSQFLSEMDGFAQNNSGVLILGATNVPWAVDSAFRRPGRFDRVLFVPPPDREARETILVLLLKGRPGAESIDVRAVAAKTPGFSGADLSNLVETASDLAIEASLEKGLEVPLSNRHFQDALAEIKPTTVEWLTTARNYARYANEAGHYDDVLDFLNKHGKS